MGYFRPFFKAEPALIHSTSNEKLMERWKQDHPKHTPKDVARARQNLANLKSLLRRKDREANGKGGKSVRTRNTATAPKSRLEILEAQIDDCLLMARNLDSALLENAIKHLRLARNEVVWKLG
jgi:hypothetical protein